MSQQLNDDNDQCYKEQDDGKTVDAMHITYPFGMRPVRIFLFYIEVFCYLPPHSHLLLFYVIVNQPGNPKKKNQRKLLK